VDKQQTLKEHQIAEAVRQFQTQNAGHAPRTVSVVLGEDTLVATLQEALTPAEKSLSRSAKGAAQVQEFHRRLFAISSDPLRREIQRITGRTVRDAAAEVPPTGGSLVQAFTSGTMVQVFLLAPPAPVGRAPRPSAEPASRRLRKPKPQ